MKQGDIGIIGLGVMGSNLALNIADKGYKIAVHNRTAARIDEFVAGAGELKEQIIPNAQLADFVSSIKAPRMILIMVKAGKPVDQTIAALMEHLDKGDIIIEAGNSNFTDSERRFETLQRAGFGFLGIGVSGGSEGARFGPSIMVGGAKTHWLQAKEILQSIGAKFKGESCADYMGEGGAGHFVKTIHNGIEYADMQMIAEIYGIMRDGMGMSPLACSEIFKSWNEGALNSYLIEVTGHVLAKIDQKTGRPLIELIVDQAGQKGTGRWSAIAATKLGVAATSIEGAVAARALSALKQERVAAEKIYARQGGVQQSSVELKIEALEQALIAGKIAAYAQGFAVLNAASKENEWDLPLATIAKIWRAGCIIRSRFLDQMSSALEKGSVENLLIAPDFVTMMSNNQNALRQVVSLGAINALPTMCLGAALSYFDTYKMANGTANLIQGQRDFFGAHGFYMSDREGMQNEEWPSTLVVKT
ncbi:6-phosphogluconate dehydrogenase, decarboxylating [hydrothermal vent metagenome]|uniref:6-phosphogluconate dehydrogenase, decarboxylating n=1 Tax=hydrothermal vent metagenome TaxID=652676 RepID=A0A3B0UDU9_9ZZZZ